VAGFVGGTLGTTFNTPFDVVKSRIQNARGRARDGAAPLYNWTLPGLVTIARAEGCVGQRGRLYLCMVHRALTHRGRPTALWKGYVPKVVRLGPGGGILLVVFDVVAQWIRTHLL
jgi:solute carrier family 25 (mitochondrial 2-oxodicarboxylate transporter), member 21